MLYSKDGDIMANDKLSEQSMDFAVQIINLVKQLKEHCESSAFLFGNEAHLRCMKNEAGLRPMKRAFGSRRS